VPAAQHRQRRADDRTTEEGGRMRIGLTGIFVDDQDHAERFYTQVLGLKVKTNSPTALPSAG